MHYDTAPSFVVRTFRLPLSTSMLPFIISSNKRPLIPKGRPFINGRYLCAYTFRCERPLVTVIIICAGRVGGRADFETSAELGVRASCPGLRAQGRCVGRVSHAPWRSTSSCHVVTCGARARG